MAAIVSICVDKVLLERVARHELTLDVRAVELDRRAAAIDEQEHRLRSSERLDCLYARLRERERDLERREQLLAEREQHPPRAFVGVGAVERLVEANDESNAAWSSALAGGGVPPGEALCGRGGGTAGGGSLPGCTGPISSDCQTSDTACECADGALEPSEVCERCAPAVAAKLSRTVGVLYRGFDVVTLDRTPALTAGQAAARAGHMRCDHDYGLRPDAYEIRDHEGQLLQPDELVLGPTVYVDVAPGAGG